MKNKSGFSLVELMITLGVMSAIAVGYMKMMSHQTKQNKTNLASQEINNLYSEMRAFLSKPGICSKTFEGKTLVDDLEIQSIKKKNGSRKYFVNQVYGNRAVKIKSIVLSHYEEEHDNPLKGSAQLVVTMEKMGKVYGGKFLRKKIELDFIIDSDDSIVECAPLGSNVLGTITLPSQMQEIVEDSTTQEETKKQQDEQEDKKQDKNTKTVNEQKLVKKDESNLDLTNTQSVMKVIQMMHTDPSKVDPKDAKKIQAIINANPQLKDMQNLIKDMQEMQKQQEKLLQQP